MMSSYQLTNSWPCTMRSHNYVDGTNMFSKGINTLFILLRHLYLPMTWVSWFINNRSLLTTNNDALSCLQV